jgi:hypothetical protein
MLVERALGQARPLTAIRTIGAVSRVDPDDGAYAHRSALYNLSLDAGWTDPALDSSAIGWARRVGRAHAFRRRRRVHQLLGFRRGGGRTAGAVYRRNRDRLAAVRAACDSEGLFEAPAAPAVRREKE